MESSAEEWEVVVKLVVKHQPGFFPSDQHRAVCSLCFQFCLFWVFLFQFDNEQTILLTGALRLFIQMVLIKNLKCFSKIASRGCTLMVSRSMILIDNVIILNQ